MTRAERLIAALGLAPLPLEGGWYRETYRAVLRLAGGKSVSTAIYYLLTPDTFSALHRLPADEVFHFYAGDPVEMVQLGPAAGEGRVVVLGGDVLAGQAPQVVVPAGVWQGSALAAGGEYALLGTTMAPGFDFSDYEAGERGALAEAFPAWRGWIERVTR
jgi:predicted cupin superfamily sugar epimerase